MTQQTALQLVQNECERLSAKYELRAYVLLPSPLNEGDKWGKQSICRVVIGEGGYVPISNEWADTQILWPLQSTMETAFHGVAVHTARLKMHALAVAGQR